MCIRDRNLIINCGGIPIDLEGDGVTTNDAGDSDTGPNELLNFPLITEAFTDNEEAVYAKLYFEGKPFEYYEINWYLVESSNFENHGELNQWLGRTGQNADASGIVDEEFTFGREKQVDPSSEICCTIMEYDANITSEVSSNINMASNNNLTRWGRNHITFDISGPGPHIIQPNSPFLVIILI